MTAPQTLSLNTPIDALSDPELVALAKAGDTRAFGQLYERHSPIVLHVCNRFAKCEMDAENLAQEAWVRALTRLHQFRGEAKFSTWLLWIAVNQSKNFCASVDTRTRHQGHVEERLYSDNCLDVDPEVWTQQYEEIRALIQQLEKLPDIYQEPLRLMATGHSPVEISSHLGLCVNTTRTRINRARQRLKSAIRPVKKDASTNPDIAWRYDPNSEPGDCWYWCSGYERKGSKRWQRITVRGHWRRRPGKRLNANPR